MSLVAAQYHRCGASSVLLMLPGAMMTPEQMVQAGLLDAVQQRGLALDLVLPDLHALQACNRDALNTLQAELLAPARAQYQQVWLGGISRGGQLALSAFSQQLGPLDGLCLLAPYAGSRLTTNAIARAGGLQAWSPSAEQLQDPEFRLWQWLKDPAVDVPVFMGYGAQDRFADGMQRLAQCLPQATLSTLPGGHDWTAWQGLWAQFLDQGYFPPLASSPASP